MKLWAGRFQKETDTLVNDFNSSIGFDARMYRQDITGSIAHAGMLGKQGIIEQSEADKIIAAMPPDSYKIALCVEGTQYDSERLAGVISAANDKSGKISLVIGSSHGLSERVKRECDLRLSVSKMTFPHQLMRVVLAEQIYRAFKINANEKYHK